MNNRIAHINKSDLKLVPTPKKGQTLCGYGNALPTRFKIKYEGYWYSVKAICFSNCASFYIKHSLQGKIFINDNALEVKA